MKNAGFPVTSKALYRDAMRTYKLTLMLIVTYRIISWLCATIALTNAVFVASDCWRHSLSMGTTGITLVVAAFFAWLGMVALGVERSLSKLRLCSVTDSEKTDWQRSWKRLVLFLMAGMLFLLMVMLVGLSGIYSRYLEGYPLFG